MRAFAKPTPIERLSLEARVVYTGFCVFLLLGCASSIWLFWDDGLGPSPSSATTYYLGQAQPKMDAQTKDGPSLALPPNLADVALHEPRSSRQMMETFHFHLFSMPVCLLIIAHLFMMCRGSAITKAVIIAATFCATLVHLLLPLLVRFGSPLFASGMFPSATLMGALWIYMTVTPVYEMWVSNASRTAP